METDRGLRINVPEQVASPRETEQAMFRIGVNALQSGDVAILVTKTGGDLTVQTYGTDDDTMLLGVYALGRVLVEAQMARKYRD